MNRNSRDSLIGGGRSMLPIHRRGLSVNGAMNLKDSTTDRVDLFSKSRKTDESDASLKLGKLSVGSAKQAKNGSEDLLSSGGEKHDYDWLLTPPGTPMAPSSNGSESQTSLLDPRGRTLARSTSTTKASQLSTSSAEHGNAAKPSRSSSLTRPSLSSSRYSNYSNKSTAILNTSSASVSSYTRAVTPARRSVSSTPSPRQSVPRSTTPSNLRPTASSSLVDKARPSLNSRPSTPTSRSQPSLNSRPSTPTSRSQPSTNSNGTPVRIASRPSTPTRHNTAYSSPASVGSSTNGRRSVSNGQSSTPVSSPSSLGSFVRPSPQSIVLPDYSPKTPQTPRATLPDRRPLSVGRSRPGAAERNDLIPNTTTTSTRHPSPVVTNGRIASYANGHPTEGVESHRESTRNPLKISSESTGFGRTLSKSSLDMAIRHMDIRNGTHGLMSLAATKLFPQSIRSSRQKNQSITSSIAKTSNDAAENSTRVQYSERRIAEVKSEHSAKITSPDIYESSRYDMMLLKEDVKNTNWLHSIDDKPDQELMFDNGFGPLPEPFGPL